MSHYEIARLRSRVSEMETAAGKPTIRVAANALIVHDGQVLLVEFDDVNGPHFNFPGGGVEPSETLEEAVRREVLEETCLDVSVERLLLIVESVGSRNTNTVRGRVVPWNELRFFFLCTTNAPGQIAGLPDRPDEDQVGVSWLPIEELASAPVLPQIGALLVAAMARPESVVVVPNPHS